jgi:cytochrome oxidase Cu insertion factor (SCO1/SenC/PrrC family)
MNVRLPLVVALSLSAAPAAATPPEVALGVHSIAPTPAPRVMVTGLAGTSVELAPQPGKILLVAFWATWCDACRVEIPGLMALGRALEARHPGRFQVVAISMDQELGALKAYLGQLPRRGPPGWTVLLDSPDQTALAAFYTAARKTDIPDEYQLPQAYVIDGGGALVGWLEGPRDWSNPAARAYLEALLRGGAPSGLRRQP